MEQENFEAKLTKLAHDIEQLDAKIDDKILTLREELRKLIWAGYLLQARDITTMHLDIRGALDPNISKACERVWSEPLKLDTMG